jgi:hypothetical protein
MLGHGEHEHRQKQLAREQNEDQSPHAWYVDVEPGSLKGSRDVVTVDHSSSMKRVVELGEELA